LGGGTASSEEAPSTEEDDMNARVIGILFTGTLLVACSGNDAGGGAAGGESSSGTTSTITMRDDEFVPSTVTIAAGDVDLVNEGESPHNFTIEGQGVDVDVDPGTTTTQPIDLAAGTYTIFCEFHRSDGMQGSLTVEG
jgi:plastocyanin